MKIGIDVSQIAHRGSGVARYVYALINALLKYDKENEYVLFFSSLRQNFPQDLKNNLKENFKLKNSFVPPTLLDMLWNRLHILPIENFTGNVDVFFTSDWVEPPAKKAFKITTVHDLITYKFPETSLAKIIETQKRRLGWVKKESDLVLCDSQATKKDIIEILGIDAKKLEVLYPSVETHAPSDRSLKETKDKYEIKKPFILTVGKIEPRKNIPKLIEAFKKTGLQDVDLYVVGPKGWESTNLQETDNVKFLGFVPDQDLHALYKQAMFFVYPSLYEGFGYPVVEAMSLRCPVAVSNNSSLKEITENNGLLFDPNSVNDIAKAILMYYKDETLRNRMSEKGLKRAQDFTQEKFARNLIGIFDQIFKK